LNAAFGRLPPIPGWDTLAWLKGEMALLACVMVGVLWYAPFAAYCSWSRLGAAQSVLVGHRPVVLAPLLERMPSGPPICGIYSRTHLRIWQTLFPYRTWRGRADALASVFGQLRFGAAFRDIDLWLGWRSPRAGVRRDPPASLPATTPEARPRPAPVFPTRLRR